MDDCTLEIAEVDGTFAAEGPAGDGLAAATGVGRCTIDLTLFGAAGCCAAGFDRSAF